MNWNKLQELKKSIYSLQPLDKLIALCQEIGLFVDESLQNVLVKEILRCELLRNYPLPLNYCKDFLTRLIKTIESTGNEASDELYLFLSEIICCDPAKIQLRSHILLVLNNQDLSFKNNLNNSSKPIRNKDFEIFMFGFENCNLLGMRPWSAGFRLVEWLVHSSNFNKNINGSDIIELGSGIGISSIIPYLILPISSICSTDYDPEIILNLKYNYFINGIALENQFENNKIFDKERNNAKVACLDWETVNIDVTDELVRFSKKPMFISSDVIYENNLTYSFVKTLKLLLMSSFKKQFGYLPEKPKIIDSDLKQIKWSDLPQTDFSSISTYAVSVNTLRNESTIQYFVDCCIENNLKISVDFANTPTLFQYESNCPIIVFIIHY